MAKFTHWLNTVVDLPAAVISWSSTAVTRNFPDQVLTIKLFLQILKSYVTLLVSLSFHLSEWCRLGRLPIPRLLTYTCRDIVDILWLNQSRHHSHHSPQANICWESGRHYHLLPPRWSSSWSLCRCSRGGCGCSRAGNIWWKILIYNNDVINQGGRSCAGARGAPAEKFWLGRKF